MTVRVCRPDEVGAVLDLWDAARSEHAVTADTEAAVELLLERDPDGLLVAEQDGRLAGALIAAFDGWRGNMYRLAVLPDRRRRGIALELVREGERRLRARGARRVTALVAYEDGAATALWRAAGYALDEQIGRFVKNLDGG